MSELAFSERRALHQHDNLQHTRLPLYVDLNIEFARRWPMRLFAPRDPETARRMDLRRAMCSIEAGYCLDAPGIIPAGSIVFDGELEGIDGVAPSTQSFFDRE